MSDLNEKLASTKVFIDVHSIAPGADFTTVLDQALTASAAVLVLIGPKWVDAVDKKGRRRLELEDDWVRLEVQESLRRPEVRVFPILVDGAEMPAAEELPEPLRPLARRQAFTLTVRHWGEDVSGIADTLRTVISARDSSASTTSTQSPAIVHKDPTRSTRWLVTAAAVFALVGGTFIITQREEGNAPPSPLPPEPNNVVHKKERKVLPAPPGPILKPVEDPKIEPDPAPAPKVEPKLVRLHNSHEFWMQSGRYRSVDQNRFQLGVAHVSRAECLVTFRSNTSKNTETHRLSVGKPFVIDYAEATYSITLVKIDAGEGFQKRPACFFDVDKIIA